MPENRRADAHMGGAELDRDGKIDIFFFDDSPETGEAFWILFLSSHAQVSEIVGRAAQLHRTGD